MPLLVEVSAGLGVRVTNTVSANPRPAAVITPLVGLTVTPETNLVAAVESQLFKLEGPLDCTISVTQVRAALAASTTSDALARFV
jgi:hypothetical protein